MYKKEHPYVADYSVFKKSVEEKQQLKKLKKAWENNMRVFYGKDKWKKERNFPIA